MPLMPTLLIHNAHTIATQDDALRELQGWLGDDVAMAVNLVDGPLSRSWRDYREAVARLLARFDEPIARIEGNEIK